MPAASASIPLPKSANETWECCLWTNRCGNRRRLRWENSLLLPGIWARDVLSAFFAFCLFVTVGQKKGNTKPQTNPKLDKQSKWSNSITSHCTCCPSALVTVWWMRNGGICHCWKSSVPTRTGIWVPKKGLFQLSQKVPFPLGRAGRVGKCGALSGCSAEELLLPLFFKEPPWNVFMLREKWAYNFPELLAFFQEGIVLCVNSFWGWCVVIAAPGRMGGKEIPFSLQSCEVFFC